MLFFKVSYKTIQFLFPAQRSFTESFQVLTPIPLHTVLGQLGKTELLSHPTPTQSPNPPFFQLTMLLLKVSYKTIQFLFPAQWSFTESFQILTPTPLYTVSGQLGKMQLQDKNRFYNILHLQCSPITLRT